MINTRFLLSATLTAGLVIALSTPAFSMRPGNAAPDFTLQNVNGEAISLSDFEGQTVVLEWANYGCPYVVMHYETNNIPSLQQKYDDEGVVWLTIHSSAPGEQGYYELGELGAQSESVNNAATHVLADPEGNVGRLYDAKTTPQIYVIDAEGMLQYNGAIDSIPSTNAETLTQATPYADNAIAAVLAGETPSPATSQPYGCTVKYKEN